MTPTDLNPSPEISYNSRTPSPEQIGVSVKCVNESRD